jgi:hypothetical protein
MQRSGQKQRSQREQRRAYVTRNTEYHFLDNVCVAVRDRRRGCWLLSHPALESKLSGCVRFRDNGEPFPCLEAPRVGDALFFGEDGPDLVTSIVSTIERPDAETVYSYPASA